MIHALHKKQSGWEFDQWRRKMTRSTEKFPEPALRIHREADMTMEIWSCRLFMCKHMMTANLHLWLRSPYPRSLERHDAATHGLLDHR